MKENTYDIKTYQFGIIAPKKEYSDEEIRKLNELAGEDIISEGAKFIKDLASKDCPIINFDDIDGLTLEDIKSLELCKGDTIIFILYDEVNKIYMNKVSPNIFVQYFSFIDVKGKSKNSLVSNLIEKDLLLQYNESSQNAKRRIRCFLERYQYKTKGHVTKVLKNINNK